MTMKDLHTTNYFNTFIEVADDCKALESEIPPMRGETLSVANIQFDMISKNPYRYTSDDVIFNCYAVKNELTSKELKKERTIFYSKGQACLRCSPLPKRYGWGIHYNKEGKVALVVMGSQEYEKLATDPKMNHVKAMRPRRA